MAVQLHAWAEAKRAEARAGALRIYWPVAGRSSWWLVSRVQPASRAPSTIAVYQTPHRTPDGALERAEQLATVGRLKPRRWALPCLSERERFQIADLLDATEERVEGAVAPLPPLTEGFPDDLRAAIARILAWGPP